MQLPTSVSAYHPTNMEDVAIEHEVRAWQGPEETRPQAAKEPSRDLRSTQPAQVRDQCCSLLWLGGDRDAAAAAASLPRSQNFEELDLEVEILRFCRDLISG